MNQVAVLLLKMKSIAFLTFTLFIVLTIDSIVAPKSKYKLASIAQVSVNEGEDPWGPFRQHIQDYNLSPKAIGKNCRVSYYYSYYFYHLFVIY